jgi:hypothetical protein
MLTLQQRLKTACQEHPDVLFRNDYSGRSMYSNRCVGIVGARRDCMRVISAVMQDIAAANGAHGVLQVEEWFDTLLNYDMDNMGRDMILYWPSLESIEVPGPDDTNNG